VFYFILFFLFTFIVLRVRIYNKYIQQLDVQLSWVVLFCTRFNIPHLIPLTTELIRRRWQCSLRSYDAVGCGRWHHGLLIKVNASTRRWRGATRQGRASPAAAAVSGYHGPLTTVRHGTRSLIDQIDSPVDSFSHSPAQRCAAPTLDHGLRSAAGCRSCNFDKKLRTQIQRFSTTQETFSACFQTGLLSLLFSLGLLLYYCIVMMTIRCLSKRLTLDPRPWSVPGEAHRAVQLRHSSLSMALDHGPWTWTWNSPPDSLRHPCTESQHFRRQLKTHFFAKYWRDVLSALEIFWECAI